MISMIECLSNGDAKRASGCLLPTRQSGKTSSKRGHLDQTLKAKKESPVSRSEEHSWENKWKLPIYHHYGNYHNNILIYILYLCVFVFLCVCVNVFYYRVYLLYSFSSILWIFYQPTTFISSTYILMTAQK